MYGLPDSAILGTAKRLKGSKRSRRRPAQELGMLEVLQELLHAGYVLHRRYKATHRKKK
jgi:hypothetical protein